MKNLLVLLSLVLFTSSAVAEEVVQTLVTSNTSFTTKSKEKMVFQAVLQWNNYDSAKNGNGYAIAKAKAVRFVNPELPDGCDFVPNSLGSVLTGGFDGLSAFLNRMSFVLAGATCGEMFSVLTTGSFELEVLDVPGMQNPTQVTPVVRISIEN